MASQALFYEQAMPVRAERHRGWYVDSGAGYAFSRNVNSVPLTGVEFARAAREYPIVFVTEEETTFPAVVLGLRDRQNLYIRHDGGWDAEYIPAFVRRYPFVFATGDGGRTFTLCIDEGFVGCNQEGEGQPLFLEGGARSPYLERALAFLSEYQLQYQRTRDFGARLRELDLLEPVTANISLRSGEKRSLTGFLTVSRERLRRLDGATLKALLDAEQLELVFIHLLSLGVFPRLVDRLAATPEE